MRRHRGSTLLEVLTVVAISGVLASTMLPGLLGFVGEQRTVTRANAFLASVQLARSEAARQNRPVTLCASADGRACGTDLGRGWLVFVDADGDGRRDADEPVLEVGGREYSGVVVSSRSRFTYNPSGRRSTNGTVTFCHPAGASGSRAVIVSYTGRPRVAQRLADGRPLPC